MSEFESKKDLARKNFISRAYDSFGWFLF